MCFYVLLLRRNERWIDMRLHWLDGNILYFPPEGKSEATKTVILFQMFSFAITCLDVILHIVNFCFIGSLWDKSGMPLLV